MEERTMSCENQIHFTDPLCPLLTLPHTLTALLWPLLCSPYRITSGSPSQPSLLSPQALQPCPPPRRWSGSRIMLPSAFIGWRRPPVPNTQRSGPSEEPPRASVSEGAPIPSRKGDPKADSWRLNIPIGNGFTDSWMWVSCYIGTKTLQSEMPGVESTLFHSSTVDIRQAILPLHDSVSCFAKQMWEVPPHRVAMRSK